MHGQLVLRKSESTDACTSEKSFDSTHPDTIITLIYRHRRRLITSALTFVVAIFGIVSPAVAHVSFAVTKSLSLSRVGFQSLAVYDVAFLKSPAPSPAVNCTSPALSCGCRLGGLIIPALIWYRHVIDILLVDEATIAVLFVIFAVSAAAAIFVVYSTL